MTKTCGTCAHIVGTYDERTYMCRRYCVVYSDGYVNDAGECHCGGEYYQERIDSVEHIAELEQLVIALWLELSFPFPRPHRRSPLLEKTKQLGIEVE